MPGSGSEASRGGGAGRRSDTGSRVRHARAGRCVIRDRRRLRRRDARPARAREFHRPGCRSLGGGRTDHRRRCVHLPRVRARIERHSPRHLWHGRRQRLHSARVGRGSRVRTHGRVIARDHHRPGALAAACIRRVPPTAAASPVMRGGTGCTARRGRGSRLGAFAARYPPTNSIASQRKM